MNKYYKRLCIKVNKKKATVGVVGLGYVGLNLLINLDKNKIKVYGYDSDKNKIKKLQNGYSTISYIRDYQIRKTLKNSIYSSSAENLKFCDFIIICLPTPLTKNNLPDLSHLKEFSLFLSKIDLSGKVIILESTSYPGTTKEIFLPPIESQFLNVGKNVFLGFSPEREDPGNKIFNFFNTPKVVSGTEKNSLTLVKKLYSTIVKKIIISPSIEVAESAKLLENIFRSVNISMINEMKFALKKMNINIYDVINVAKTKPFGFMTFYPGPGVGGHCIPIDPLYFSWKSKQFGYNPKFIELASKVNINVTNNISKQILKIVRKNNAKNKKILILGISYKKNIEDTRESASLKIFQYLYSNKIRVEFYDPYVKSEYLILDKYKKKIFSINLNYVNLKKYSHVIIATDHDILNYDKIYTNSKLIIDLRRRYKDSKKIISI